MLPIAYRLPKEHIRATLRNGRRIHSPPLLGYLLPNDVKTPRAAIIVGKRAAKLASKRNRIKRLIRHSLAAMIPLIIKPTDITIVVQETPKELSLETVNSLVELLLRRAQLL